MNDFEELMKEIGLDEDLNIMFVEQKQKIYGKRDSNNELMFGQYVYTKELLPLTVDEKSREALTNFLLDPHLPPGKAFVFHSLHAAMMCNEEDWQLPNTYPYVPCENGQHLHVNLRNIMIGYDINHIEAHQIIQEIYKNGINYLKRIRKKEIPLDKNRKILTVFPNSMVYESFINVENVEYSTSNENYPNLLKEIYSCIFFDEDDELNVIINTKQPTLFYTTQQYNYYVAYKQRTNSDLPYNMPITKLLAIQNKIEDPEILILNPDTTIVEEEEEDEEQEYNIFTFPAGTVSIFKINKKTKQLEDMTVQEYLNIKNDILSKEKNSHTYLIYKYFKNKYKYDYDKRVGRKLFENACLISTQSKDYKTYLSMISTTDEHPIKTIRKSLYAASVFALYEYMEFVLQLTDEQVIDYNLTSSPINTAISKINDKCTDQNIHDFINIMIHAQSLLLGQEKITIETSQEDLCTIYINKLKTQNATPSFIKEVNKYLVQKHKELNAKEWDDKHKILVKMCIQRSSLMYPQTKKKNLKKRKFKMNNNRNKQKKLNK